MEIMQGNGLRKIKYASIKRQTSERISREEGIKLYRIKLDLCLFNHEYFFKELLVDSKTCPSRMLSVHAYED